MKHLGDITKISGLTAPIVDCIIGGSPCQDLSVAGKRAGLDGERSGLFMEQIRIIKEMREQDVRSGRSGVDVRPRYMVWENVPGSLSSPGKDNIGEDFRCVLEEVARIVEEGVTIPRPAKGKWTTTGVIIGDGYSIAWKVCDAQYFGVPQRRRRIALVADFNGYTAPRILFGEAEHNRSTERGDTESSVGNIRRKPRSKIQPLCEGLSRDIEQSIKEGEEAPTDATRSLRADDSEGARRIGIDPPITIDMGGGKSSVDIHTDRSPTLTTTHYGEPAVAYSVENHPADSRVNIDESGKVQTLTSRMGTGGGNVPMVMQCYSKSKRAQTNTDYETWNESETANTLNAFDTGDVRTTEVIVALDRASFNQGKNAKYDFEISENGINSPIVAKGPSAVCYGIGSYDSNAWKSKNPDSGVYEADTARTLDSINCGYPACNQGGTAVVQGFPEVSEGVVGTLDAHYANFPGCRGGVERTMVVAVDCRNGTEDQKNGALQSNMAHSLNGNNVVRTRYIVRRLTPLECERLQGFPDGWTDIGEYIDTNGKKKQSSDAARYKALGNSIARPAWKWILKKLCACYERDATMASLFDGIGGFPSLWEQINGKGSCLWASEIEGFPMAVTKTRIGG